MSEAMLILQLLAQYGPGLAKAAQEILRKPQPTEADWEAIWKLTREPFEVGVPQVPKV